MVHPKQRAMFNVAARLEGNVNQYILKAFKDLQGRVSIDKIARLLATAPMDEVISAANANGIGVITTGLTDELSAGIASGAKLAANEIKKVAVIDMLSPGVQDWMKNRSLSMLQDIDNTSIECLKYIIDQGMLEGKTQINIAKDIKRTIGLNARQGEAVSRRWGVLQGQGLKQSQIEKLVNKYADELLKNRAQTIARTETMAAINHGRLELWEQLQEEGALPLEAEKEYLTAVDERVCPMCGPLDGERQPLSGQFTGGYDAPPLHPNCIPAGSIIDDAELIASTKRWYEGDLINVQTLDRRIIPITPNHPVLTPHGFIAAKFLKKGDNIISSSFCQGTRNSVIPNGQNMPSLIEQIHDTLRFSQNMTFASMPVTTMQFHGDGFENSEVDIVYSASALRNNQGNAPLIKPFSKQSLSGRSVQRYFLNCLSMFYFRSQRFRTAPNSIVSRISQSLSFLLASLRHTNIHGFAAVTGPNAEMQKPPSDNLSIGIEQFGNSLFGDTIKIKSTDLLDGQFNARGYHLSSIENISVNRFAGHVYNLQTKDGWYACNGIVTSNCRCTMLIHERPKQ